MNFLPVPGWKELFGALRRSPRLDDQELAAPWRRPGDLVYWFSRSAWSLHAITMWRTACRSSPRVNFWIPDYFCNEALGGVRSAGANLVFYPVTENMAPDWAACRVLAAAAKPDVFVLVHYFGRPGSVVQAGEFCQQHNAVFVEDCAHVLLPTGEVGSRGDFVFYSPHKHLALPDGALLLARPAVMRRVGGSSESFADSFADALATLPRGTPPSWKWLIKGLVVKHAPDFPGRFRGGKEPELPASPAQTGLPWPPAQSALSRSLLAQKLPHLEAVGWLRVQNATILRSSTLTGGAVEMIGPQFDGGFPHSFGLRLKDNSSVLGVRRLARAKGCPVARWPDLPPEVAAAPEQHNAAIKLWRQAVFFPVHPAVSARKLVLRMGVRMAERSVSPKTFSVRWDVPVRRWDELFQAAPFSSLLQSRAYAEAMGTTRGWSARLGAVESSGDVVTVFVVLEKRGPCGMAIGRLNRGPVWLDGAMNDRAKLAALNSIVDQYPLRRGRVLFFAPNLEMKEEFLLGLVSGGCRRRCIRPWSSVWLDLRQSEDEHFEALDGKWRNQLVAGQRKGLQLDQSEDESAFEWMLTRHGDLMTTRKFAGPQTTFLRKLRAGMRTQGDNLWILQARHDGIPVAGIGVARHGTSATYLIGWNEPDGRRLNAGNFLVWEAALLARRAGCGSLDLGGTNEWVTPGITAFKRGLRGREYRLLGEYVSHF